jgi:hypothetical protein
MKKWWKTRDWDAFRGFTGRSLQIASASYILAAGIFAFTELGYHYGSKIFWFLGKTLGKGGADSVLVLVVCGVGYLAHRFKQWQQGWYGLTEIGFGVISAANVAFTMIPGNSTLPQWIGLLACIYITVRGLGNLNEVIERKKELKLNALRVP